MTQQFDKKAAEEKYFDMSRFAYDKSKLDSSLFVAGAEWQFNRDSAVIEKLEAELNLNKNLLAAANEVSDEYSKRCQKLRTNQAKLVEALKFYSRIEVWGNGCAAIDPCDTYTCELNVLRGGKLARKTLQELNLLTKEEI